MCYNPRMRWVYAAVTVLIILLALGILFSRRAEAPTNPDSLVGAAAGGVVGELSDALPC